MRERRQETKKKQAWWRLATGDRCWWRNICCDPSLIRLRLSFFFNTTVTRPSHVNASSIQNSTQPNPVTLLTLRLLVPPVSMTPTHRTCLLDPTGSVTRLYWLLTGCVNTPIYMVYVNASSVLPGGMFVHPILVGSATCLPPYHSHDWLTVSSMSFACVVWSRCSCFVRFILLCLSYFVS